MLRGVRLCAVLSNRLEDCTTKLEDPDPEFGMDEDAMMSVWVVETNVLDVMTDGDVEDCLLTERLFSRIENDTEELPSKLKLEVTEPEDDKGMNNAEFDEDDRGGSREIVGEEVVSVMLITIGTLDGLVEITALLCTELLELGSRGFEVKLATKLPDGSVEGLETRDAVVPDVGCDEPAVGQYRDT